MATNSSSSTTNAALLPTPAFNHMINVKLSRENYLLWRAQLLPYLRSQHLLGYVDGTIARPAPTVAQPPTKEGECVSVIANPAYDVWFQQDQLVLSTLLSSLTEDVLSHVIFLPTSQEVWMALEKMFSSGSRARSMQIRMQLSTMQKKDMSIADYFRKAKNLADTLSAIGSPLPDEEIISYILAGLGSEYDPLVTSITTRNDPITLGDLYAHMMSFELRLDHNNTVFQMSSANNVNRSQPQSRGNGKSGRGRGRNYNNSPAKSSGGRGNSSQGGPRPTCQICSKIGHDALCCYKRFDHGYQPEDKVAAAANSAYSVDSSWYVDTGATDHITHDLERLTTRERYTGNDQVQVANGTGSGHEDHSSQRQV